MSTIARNVLCILILSIQALTAMNADSTAAKQTSPRKPLLPTVSVSAFTEIWNGEVSEYVWEDNYVKSELNWGISDMTMTGASVNLVWRGKLFIGGEFSTATSSKTSYLDDSDWTNISSGDPYTKTHYSHHNTVLAHAESARVDAGWQFTPHVAYSFSITPTLGFRYISWKWDAWDGYTQYPPESEPKNFKGLGISYAQEIMIPNISLGIHIPAVRMLSCSFSATLSPFAQCYAVDNHHARNLTFHDLLEGGTFFETSMGVEFKPLTHFSLKISATSSRIMNLRGSTAEQTGTSTNYSWGYYSSGDGGGAELLAEQIRAALTIIF